MTNSAIPAAIPSDDRGFTLGHGLFETILADHGRLALFEPHVARLSRACVPLGLPVPDAEALKAAALQALSDADLLGARAAVRLTWSAGSGGRGLDAPAEPAPRLVATAAPAPARTTPLRLSLSSVRRNESSPTARFKTLSYIDNVVARAEARARGADEALMLNLKGQLACAAAANLFWTRGLRLYTPELDCGVLDGIIRARVIEAALAHGVVVQEVAARKFVLLRAGAVFLTNSLIGAAPVASLDGVPLGGDAPPWLGSVLAQATGG
jgi:branched-chain amino acid aminotransferase/4-amino-4-deoxychorismate lyase